MFTSRPWCGDDVGRDEPQVAREHDVRDAGLAQEREESRVFPRREMRRGDPRPAPAVEGPGADAVTHDEDHLARRGVAEGGEMVEERLEVAPTTRGEDGEAGARGGHGRVPV